MFETRIKALRVSLGLNQVEFAAQLSVTKQSVSNWENGNILPSIDMLIKICNTFSVVLTKNGVKKAAAESGSFGHI